ncbi:MAG: DUF2752 domain-containing protein [Firmicutes bacterium]|nr:DUF2752 domain-containing protein [Bacillota bacterium]
MLFIVGLLFFFIIGERYCCPFKFFTGIPCPGCGLTRAFKSILKFNLAEAIRLNILSPIIFLWFSITFFALIYDMVFNTDYIDKIIYIKLNAYHYIGIILLVLLSLYFNIIRGI